MARIVRFHEFGAPDVLRLETVPDRAPGSSEVAIKVEAVGLDWADALWRQNMYVEDASLPSGLGNEAAGQVRLSRRLAQNRRGDHVVIDQYCDRLIDALRDGFDG
jgi:NADPH:quinone reductase-like Zn-dependent oxidoreductase